MGHVTWRSGPGLDRPMQAHWVKGGPTHPGFTPGCATWPGRSVASGLVSARRSRAAYVRPYDPRGGPMVTVGLLAILNARSGKEDELASFLEGALPLAQAEDDTIAWFAFKIDDTTYGIFDVFPGSDGRQAHLDGPIAAALLGRAEELLSSPPDIKPIDVLAAKLPG